jgi:hemolysin III
MPAASVARRCRAPVFRREPAGRSGPNRAAKNSQEQKSKGKILHGFIVSNIGFTSTQNAGRFARQCFWEGEKMFIPGDHGPIYAETGLGAPWLVEPCNTVSNAAFLILFVYWFVKAPRQGPAARLFRLGLPVLLFSWVGGTLYHGWRSSDVYYVMDYLPIYGLAFAVSLWLWTWLKSLALGATLAVPSLTLVGVQIAHDVKSLLLHTLTYLGIGSLVIVPVCILAHRRGWRNLNLLGAGLGAFALAIFFRTVDGAAGHYFAHGTHFLWHILGALSVHLLLLYLCLMSSDRPKVFQKV